MEYSNNHTQYKNLPSARDTKIIKANIVECISLFFNYL